MLLVFHFKLEIAQWEKRVLNIEYINGIPENRDLSIDSTLPFNMQYKTPALMGFFVFCDECGQIYCNLSIMVRLG